MTKTKTMSKLLNTFDINDCSILLIDWASKDFREKWKDQLIEAIKEFDHENTEIDNTLRNVIGIKINDTVDLDWYKNKAFVYILVYNDKIIGFSYCGTRKTKIQYGSNVCFIYELYIDKNYRRLGLATYLMDYVVTARKKEESYIKAVSLNVREDNIIAKKDV